MKTHFKKISSILLAVVMIFSVCAVFSVSAAETSDSAGAGSLTVAGSSNYLTPSAQATVETAKAVSVTFKAPAELKLVDIQWGMNYDKSKLQLVSVSSFADDMLINNNATSYNVMGSISNTATPFTLAQGATLLTFNFRAVGTGETTVTLNVVDLMNRTAEGDKIIVNNGVVKQDAPFKVIAASNFFAGNTKQFDSLAAYEDSNGDVYITVEYKLLAKNKYLINVDIDALTWDPTVLEWKESYNTYGSNIVDLFPFAAENGFGAGTIHQTANNRIVGNYSSVKPAAYAFGENNEPITAVKATFRVLNRNAGETTVTCNADTVSFCDTSVQEPYMQAFAINEKVVNSDVKAQATYSTEIKPVESDVVIGDVNKDGVVNIQDATALQRYLAEFIGSSAINLKAADTNRDGKVNVRDVTQIQRYVANVITKF